MERVSTWVPLFSSLLPSFWIILKRVPDFVLHEQETFESIRPLSEHQLTMVSDGTNFPVFTVFALVCLEWFARTVMLSQALLISTSPLLVFLFKSFVFVLIDFLCFEADCVCVAQAETLLPQPPKSWDHHYTYLLSTFFFTIPFLKKKNYYCSPPFLLKIALIHAFE